MSYLLDTHTFLWFINNDLALSNSARNLIEEPNNVLYLSIASFWEMAIKVSLGKLDIPFPFYDFMQQQLSHNDIRLLEIKLEHTGIVSTLPFHHRDPFDRLIIAQAIAEKLPVIGKDEIFDAYKIQRLW